MSQRNVELVRQGFEAGVRGSALRVEVFASRPAALTAAGLDADA